MTNDNDINCPVYSDSLDRNWLEMLAMRCDDFGHEDKLKEKTFDTTMNGIDWIHLVGNWYSTPTTIKKLLRE